MAPKKNPIVLSEKAKVHLLALLEKNKAPAMRLKLRSRGCSGLSYVMDYVKEGVELSPGEEESFSLDEDGRYSLWIQKKALMFLFGTFLDYNDDPIKSGFVFNNPQEKGRCGCGQSFHI